MPRTELPSGGFVEWKDKFMAGVRFDVKDAVKSVIRAADDGSGAVQEIPGANDERQRVALWWHIITDWSFAASGIPIPSQNAAGKDGAVDLICATLDDEDYAKLAEETQSILDRFARNPKRAKPSASS